jgi:hypothetical protein
MASSSIYHLGQCLHAGDDLIIQQYGKGQQSEGHPECVIRFATVDYLWPTVVQFLRLL